MQKNFAQIRVHKRRSIPMLRCSSQRQDKFTRPWRSPYNKAGPAPRGGEFRGRSPSPNENCDPLKRGLCPEEINRLGAIGVQIEA